MVFRGLAVFKVSSEQTGGAFSLAEQLLPEGVATPLHSQPQDDETFYLLEGNLTFYLGDGRPLRASSGATVHVLKGAAHAYRVESETARMLVLTTPQHERFFRAAGEPARTRTLPRRGRPGTPRPREGSLLSIATRDTWLKKEVANFALT